jgi:hypothetical protein
MKSGLFDGSRRNYFFPFQRSLIGRWGSLAPRSYKTRENTMYLRFVTGHIDEGSERRLGVFHAAGDLWQAGKLYAYEVDHYFSVRAWFNHYL